MKTPVRVLHVDDDPALLDIAATLLERADGRLEVATETDPEAALERVRERPVDCVVSDYDMPSMTGLDLLERVRERHRDLPFVLFTGTEDCDVAAAAFDGGATDYCRKQVGTDHYRILAARIVEAVRTHQERTRLAAERDELESALRALATEADDADGDIAAALAAAQERLDERDGPADADLPNPFSDD